MSRPIVVYLDTQDFSNLCDSRLTSEYGRVKQRLLAHLSSRRIAIGLSYFHVFELLQDYTPAFKGDRLERARTLRDLSRGYAFPYVSDLREGFGLSSNGIWIPRNSAELLDVEAIGQRVLQALKTSTAMNRKARRQLRVWQRP